LADWLGQEAAHGRMAERRPVGEAAPTNEATSDEGAFQHCAVVEVGSVSWTNFGDLLLRGSLATYLVQKNFSITADCNIDGDDLLVSLYTILFPVFSFQLVYIR
jgi:hypothetical protein